MKKVLNLISIFCLTLVCSFFMMACDSKPPEGNGLSLAGKTLVFKTGGELQWESPSAVNSYHDGNKDYYSELTLNQFVSAYWDTAVIADFTNNNNLSSLAEAKQALTQKVHSEIAEISPTITISADETTACVEYPDLTIKNCTVTKVPTPNHISYQLFYNGEDIGVVNSNADGTIECSTFWDKMIPCYVEIDLSAYSDLTITLPADDGSLDSCVRPLNTANNVTVCTNLNYVYQIQN